MHPRRRGSDFEAIFEKMALMQGFLPRKMPLACRVYSDPYDGTRYLPIDGELDWQLIHRAHGIAFVDTKSTQEERLSISAIEHHQLKTAATLTSWGQIAGFCVWFRRHDVVSFFAGIDPEASEFSLHPDIGLTLGTGFDFDLAKIFETPPFIRLPG